MRSEQMLQCSCEQLWSGRETVTDTLVSSCAGAPSDSFAVLLIICYEELMGSKVKAFWGQKKGRKHTAICHKKASECRAGCPTLCSVLTSDRKIVFKQDGLTRPLPTVFKLQQAQRSEVSQEKFV